MPRIYCDICGAEFRKGKTFHAHLKKSECTRVSALMKELVAYQDIEIDNHEDNGKIVQQESWCSDWSAPNQQEELEVNTKLVSDPVDLSPLKQLDNRVEDIKQEHVSSCLSSIKQFKDSDDNFKQEQDCVIKDIKQEPVCPTLSPVKHLDDSLNCFNQKRVCPILSPVKQQGYIKECIKENHVNPEYSYSKQKVDTFDKSVWHDLSPVSQGPISLENDAVKSNTDASNIICTAHSSLSSLDSDGTSSCFRQIVFAADGEIPVFDFDCSDSDYSDGIDWDSLEAQGKLETVLGAGSKNSSQSTRKATRDKNQKVFVTDVTSSSQSTCKSNTTHEKRQAVLEKDARIIDNIPKTTRKRGRPNNKANLEKPNLNSEKNESNNDLERSSSITTPGKSPKRKKAKKSCDNICNGEKFNCKRGVKLGLNHKTETTIVSESSSEDEMRVHSVKKPKKVINTALIIPCIERKINVGTENSVINLVKHSLKHTGKDRKQEASVSHENHTREMELSRHSNGIPCHDHSAIPPKPFNHDFTDRMETSCDSRAEDNTVDINSINTQSTLVQRLPQFICGICRNVCTSDTELENHKIHHIQGEESVPESTCTESVESAQSLQHIQDEESVPESTCTESVESTQSLRLMDMLVCVKCKQTFSDFKVLKSHMATHLNAIVVLDEEDGEIDNECVVNEQNEIFKMKPTADGIKHLKNEKKSNLKTGETKKHKHVVDHLIGASSKTIQVTEERNTIEKENKAKNKDMLDISSLPYSSVDISEVVIIDDDDDSEVNDSFKKMFPPIYLES